MKTGLLHNQLCLEYKSCPVLSTVPPHPQWFSLNKIYPAIWSQPLSLVLFHPFSPFITLFRPHQAFDSFLNTPSSSSQGLCLCCQLWIFVLSHSPRSPHGLLTLTVPPFKKTFLQKTFPKISSKGSSSSHILSGSHFLPCNTYHICD